MHDDLNEYCGDGGHLLELIKEMLAENVYLIKQGDGNSDYIDGRSCALKELCVELGIATYEDLLD